MRGVFPILGVSASVGCDDIGVAERKDEARTPNPAGILSSLLDSGSSILVCGDICVVLFFFSLKVF